MNRLNFEAFLVTKALRASFFIIGLGTLAVASAQEVDLYKLPDDTAKVNRMVVYARQIQNSKPETASQIINVAQQISESLHYDPGSAAVYSFKAAQFCNKMKLDSAKIYNDKALKYVTETKSISAKNQLAAIYNTYGVIYQQKQLYDSATGMYLHVVKLCDETGNHNRKTFAFFNLSILYSFINDTLKTDRYARLAIAESKLTGDTALVLITSLALLNSFANYHNYDSILPYARPALALATQKNDLYSQAKILLIIGDYYKEKKTMQDSAHVYFQQALRLAREIKSPYDESIALFEIGNAFIFQKEYETAISYLEQALKIEDAEELLQFKTETLKSLSEAEAKSGYIDKAYLHLQEYVILNDSLTKKTNEKVVQTLEIKYQLQNKESTIALQKADIKQKNIINYILFGTAVALLVIFLLAFYNFRHRHKLQQTKIYELETEKHLSATEAVLKGEEQERTRLAKDLHDGLGGMLSGIKYSLSNMKENLIMTHDNAQAFERSIDMLDSSIKEMRRVAHNMMPEVLVKYGLNIALKEYCCEIENSGVINASYQFVGRENTDPEQTAAVAIYRIVQELVNNAIKHAAARNVLVQLHIFETEKQLTITVEDDGKGFDTLTLNNATGIGWRNIQNRVEFLKGKADISSAPGKGTSVLIEINI